jgi:HSP20 family protein
MTPKTIVVSRLNGTNHDLMRSFTRAFDPWQQFLPLSNGKWQPNTDVLETKDQYLIRMELSGVKREDINIYYQDGKLLVYGQRRDPQNRSGVRYLQLEINYHEFERILLLPDEIESDKIEAHQEEGFLLITIPKQCSAVLSKRIKVDLK